MSPSAQPLKAAPSMSAPLPPAIMIDLTLATVADRRLRSSLTRSRRAPGRGRRRA